MQWKISRKPVDYNQAVRFMEKRVEDIISGKEPEMIWLLEHPPVYTGGTSAKESDLLNPSFPVYKTGRGGQYTYHGPGQLVAYVMIDLKKHMSQPDLKKYVWLLEEWIIRTLKHYNIAGKRSGGRIGIWVKEGESNSLKEAKIAAIGIRVRKWVTYHGISINICPDLNHFKGIIPCGIKEYGVTSMQKLGVNPLNIKRMLKQEFLNLFTAII